MKEGIFTSLLLLIFAAAYSQDLAFDIRGTYEHPVKQEKLETASTMSDLIPGYPVSWISEYISAGVSVVSGDEVAQALGTNDKLSAEQQSLLQGADLGDDILVDVQYKSKNIITGNMDVRNMHYSATVVPAIEAEFPGGREPMMQYLRENAMHTIPDTAFQKFQAVFIRFTVNEEGKITNAHLKSTSGNPKTDQELLKAISKMPKWRPAENAKGIKVKQEFEFSIGTGGC